MLASLEVIRLPWPYLKKSQVKMGGDWSSLLVCYYPPPCGREIRSLAAPANSPAFLFLKLLFKNSRCDNAAFAWFDLDTENSSASGIFALQFCFKTGAPYVVKKKHVRFDWLIWTAFFFLIGWFLLDGILFFFSGFASKYC